MKSFPRMMICATLTSSLVVSMAGCENRPIRVTPSPAETSIEAVSPSHITNWRATFAGATLCLGSDGPCIGLMVPINPSVALSKISSWLQNSKPYAGDVPQSTDNLIFNGNIGPSELNIMTAQKTHIELQPAWYVVCASPGYQVKYVYDVLRVEENGKNTYLTCSPLFDWLKNDKWRTEFKAQ
ncbi:hypothetical protein [Ethanoligenens sp.]|uniref:hypothetical protein n=1 Tax=Ethanoligenens sp. TaxID=2099655 RepID=UPI0039E92492